MEDFFLFNLHYLIPTALFALAVAVVLLILRRKKNGERPLYAKRLLITALVLILFAVISIVVLPLIHFIVMFIKFGTAIFYSGLKSI